MNDGIDLHLTLSNKERYLHSDLSRCVADLPQSFNCAEIGENRGDSRNAGERTQNMAKSLGNPVISAENGPSRGIESPVSQTGLFGYNTA